MAWFEVRIDLEDEPGWKDVTRVHAVEADDCRVSEHGDLLFFNIDVLVRAFAAGGWTEVRRIVEDVADADFVREAVEFKAKVEATAAVCRQHFWTKEPPTEPGYYWHRRTDEGYASVVYVSSGWNPDDHLRYKQNEGNGSLFVRVDEVDCHWCGPIAEPMEAEESSLPEPDTIHDRAVTIAKDVWRSLIDSEWLRTPQNNEPHVTDRGDWHPPHVLIEAIAKHLGAE